MDLQIREFTQAIISFTNETNLPIEVKRLCLTDILHQLEEASNVAIKTQIEERERQRAEQAQEQTQEG